MHLDGSHLFGDVLARALYQPLAQVGGELRPGIGGDVDAASQRAAHVGGDLPDGVHLHRVRDEDAGLSVRVIDRKIQGERLDIEITSLEYDGTIIPVELAVYDTDGQPGIFIPNSMEMNAVREVAANMGGSLGSSINISTNAGAQLASDLGKGLIQGTSQYIAKKMRTVKVHLKAGYRVMLYQEKY
jgi:hypothetical protein